MNSVLQYGIESIAATGIFYLIFILFLRNKPFLAFNRFILLAMVSLGIILPFVEISLPQDSQAFANVPVSSVIVDTLKTLKMKYPPPPEGLDGIKVA